MIAIATKAAPRAQDEPIRIALCGNPNSGKTSLFNALTGARQHVGNYPGVTVERREGSFRHAGQRFAAIDLPGTYSLTSFSPEERIAQDELLAQQHDVVIVVVDSTTLERSLVFLAQVLLTGANTILCLNMSDEARAAGQQIDLVQMETLIGIPVIETVGHRGIGIDGLLDAIGRAVAHGPSRHRVVLGDRLDRAIAAVAEHLDAADAAAHSFVATKLLTDDPAFVARAAADGDRGARALATAAAHRQRIEAETGSDLPLFVTERTFGFVDGLLREVVTKRRRADARAVSDSIDSILVSRFWGLPIFAMTMYAIFWLTFSVGEIPMGWIESGFAALGGFVGGLWPAAAESPLRSLLVDGIIGGVGGVLVFLPNILLLFCGLAILEDTGYMARAAFLMDRVMHRFGLHGKSFIPMLTGFGCSIPGIMATRTLENERDRLTTMMVLPLMSCGARLPIWLLVIPAFFAPVWRAPMLGLIYAVGIVLAMLIALLLRKSLLRGEEAPFVMELPPYRLPTLIAILRKISERAWIYMRKAGTIILTISILMWVITAYPKAEVYDIDVAIAAGAVTVVESDAAAAAVVAQPGVEVLTDEAIEHRRAAEDLRASVAGRIGRAIEPVIAPLGFDWKLGTAMLGAFAAKEVFVAQLGIVYSLGEGGGGGNGDDATQGSASLRAALHRDYPPLVGVCLMLFMLIATPCMATIAVTRRESGKWSWALLQLFGLTAIAYVITAAVFNIGRLFG